MSAPIGGPVFRRLFGYFARHRRALILAGLGAVGASIAETAAPLLVRRIVDDAGHVGNDTLTGWLAVLVIVGVLGFALGFARRWYAGSLSYGVDSDLRNEIFRVLHRLDGKQQDSLRRGQLLGRATSDIFQVERFLFNIPLLITVAVTFVASCGVMVVLSPTLSLVAVLTVPAFTVIARRGGRRVFAASWDRSDRAAEVTGVVESAIDGVRIVKGFGQELREQGRLEGESRKLFRAGLWRTRVDSLVSPSLAIIPVVAQVGVLLVGGWLALHGRLSFGTFLAFSTYLGLLVVAATVLVGQFATIQNAKASLMRLFEFLDSRPTVFSAADATPVPSGRKAIEFRDVTFGYQPDRPALRNTSFRVEPGEVLAIVGGAGAGKSTVAMLLARFYDPDSGSIEIGGHDLRTLDLSSVRSELGIVFEESFLVRGTIRSNIACDRGYDDDTIVAAARAAKAHEFIMSLPDGYDTVVGERGLSLSGGQRQRLALARVIVADPAILVLDDATSAVDAGVESEIQAMLELMLRGRTALLIARRRSTLRLADRILVLDNGIVVGSGSHEELVASCAHYRTLIGLDAPAQPDLAAAPPAVPSGGVAGDSTTTAPSSREAEGPRVDVDEARAPSPRMGMRELCRPLLVPMSIGFVLAVLDTVGQLAIPWLTRVGIDSGVSRQAIDVVVVVAAVALAVAVANWVVRVIRTRVVGRTGETLLFYLRVKAFAQLQRLGLNYYERHRSGSLITTMTTDIDSIATFAQDGLVRVLVSVLSLLGVFTALAVLDIELTIGVAAAFPVLALAIVYYRRRAGRAYGDGRESLAAVNAMFQENVTGLRVIQALGWEQQSRVRFGALVDRYIRAQKRALMHFSIFFSAVYFASVPVTVLVLAFAIPRTANGDLSHGTLIAYMLYLTMIFGPIQQISDTADSYQRAQIGLRRVTELLREPVRPENTPAPAPITRMHGEVEFEGVAFAYDGAARSAVTDVSLHIESGQTVAVVGETGAGKSTLIKLLARFYDPTAGRILVDGIDIRAFDLGDYRRRLGIVPQETTMFAGTVRDIIAYGRPDATDVQVEQAARDVGAHAMIAAFAKGYRQPVGERGQSLSAGQRQLLALARAQFVDPDILLLDEATAVLDPATEAAVSEAMERISRRRTTLIIAHRLSTASRADRIVVMGEGRIIESGTHTDLLSAGGPYSRLWAAFSRDEYDRPADGELVGAGDHHMDH